MQTLWLTLPQWDFAQCDRIHADFLPTTYNRHGMSSGTACCFPQPGKSSIHFSDEYRTWRKSYSMNSVSQILLLLITLTCYGASHIYCIGGSLVGRSCKWQWIHFILLPEYVSHHSLLLASESSDLKGLAQLSSALEGSGSSNRKPEPWAQAHWGSGSAWAQAQACIQQSVLSLKIEP